MGQYDLPLHVAKECLEFSEAIESKGNNTDVTREFDDELSNFCGFMRIAVNAEIKVITIPERYQRIYNCMVAGLEVFIILKQMRDDR